MPYNIDGTTKGGGGGGGGGYVGGGTKKSSATIGGSPGLLTSTGGLTGAVGACYQPFYNPHTKSYNISVIDPSDFNTEEDVNYYFPEPDAQAGVGRKVTVHKVILTYRELGKVTFTFHIEAYISETDSYITESVVVNIDGKVNGKMRKGLFPDKKIHTKKLSLIVTGERPEPWIFRAADAGPLSIIKVVLCGTSDEGQQL